MTRLIDVVRIGGIAVVLAGDAYGFWRWPPATLVIHLAAAAAFILLAQCRAGRTNRHS